jgi:hypothetical protein
MIRWNNSTAIPDRHFAELGPVNLIVEHRKPYPPDVWVAWSVPAMITEEDLKSKELDAAKSEAVALLSSRCLAIAGACE